MYINIWPDNWQAKVRCQLTKLITGYKKVKQANPPLQTTSEEALFFHGKSSVTCSIQDDV
jgi:hypothetical protein